jgi:superoxide reductase
MKNIPRFALCKKCGNIVTFIVNKGTPILCCGDVMDELKANTQEASTEKHLPEITIDGDNLCVAVGSVLHPMEEAHHILFIYLETEAGGQCRMLKVGNEPKACFNISNDKAVAVYEYCNLHGLWKAEVK